LDQFINLTVAGLEQGAIYSAFALALVLIWRATRVVNFAQGAMAVAAAYLAYSVTNETNSYWLGALAAIAAGAVLGVVVESGVMRWISDRSPTNAVIAALGCSLVIESILGMIYLADFRPMDPPFSRSAFTVSNGDIALLSPDDVFILGVIIAMAVGLGLLFGRTRVGLRLRSSAFAPEVSRLLGVHVSRMRTLGWVLAAGVGALTALLIIPKTTGLQPTAMDAIFVSSFTAAVLGGLDSPQGAGLGGLLIGLVLAYAEGYLPNGAHLGPIAILILLLGVLLVRPGGLFSSATARRV
jgi:branched-chain amino acid transport system permease protein